MEMIDFIPADSEREYLNRVFLAEVLYWLEHQRRLLKVKWIKKGELPYSEEVLKHYPPIKLKNPPLFIRALVRTTADPVNTEEIIKALIRNFKDEIDITQITRRG